MYVNGESWAEAASPKITEHATADLMKYCASLLFQYYVQNVCYT